VRELDELENIVSASELEIPVAIEELLLEISGFDCSGTSTLDEESEEHAVSAATAAPVKNAPSLVFVNCMF
jgi:hypothetical protein